MKTLTLPLRRHGLCGFSSALCEMRAVSRINLEGPLAESLVTLLQNPHDCLRKEIQHWVAACCYKYDLDGASYRRVTVFGGRAYAFLSRARAFARDSGIG